MDTIAKVVPLVFQGMSFLQNRKQMKKQESAQEDAQAQALAVRQQATAAQNDALAISSAQDAERIQIQRDNAQRAADDLALREKAFVQQETRIAEQEGIVEARETALQQRETSRRRARSGSRSRRALFSLRPSGSEVGLLDTLGIA